MLPCVCSVKDHRWRQNVVRAKTKQTTTDKGYFKTFHHNARSGLCSPWRTRKKPFNVIYYLYKMKQSHWLLCVAKNCDWSRKITPLSKSLNLTRALLIVELKLKANLQTFKKMLEKWSHFLSAEQLCEPKKAWTLLLKLQEFKKIPSENFWLRST